MSDSLSRIDAAATRARIAFHDDPDGTPQTGSASRSDEV